MTTIEYLMEIQGRIDFICAELGKFTRPDISVTHDKINELIRIGVEISSMCDEAADDLQ